MAAKVKRVELSLEKKIELIKASQFGKSHRDLAQSFGIGKTQVGTILKRKQAIQAGF